jgi:hypothetical protein
LLSCAYECEKSSEIKRRVEIDLILFIFLLQD